MQILLSNMHPVPKVTQLFQLLPRAAPTHHVQWSNPVGLKTPAVPNLNLPGSCLNTHLLCHKNMGTFSLLWDSQVSHMSLAYSQFVGSPAITNEEPDYITSYLTSLEFLLCSRHFSKCFNSFNPYKPPCEIRTNRMRHKGLYQIAPSVKAQKEQN